ncbi:MAG: hypothetical protein ACTHQQ_24320 [Solirubrobacteraceae bacterium]
MDSSSTSCLLQLLGRAERRHERQGRQAPPPSPDLSLLEKSLGEIRRRTKYHRADPDTLDEEVTAA